MTRRGRALAVVLTAAIAGVLAAAVTPERSAAARSAPTPEAELPPVRRSTYPIPLAAQSREFAAVTIDAAGLCVAVLTERGDLWVQRDISTASSFGCRMVGSKPFAAAGLGDAEPEAALDLLAAGVDDFVAIAYTDSAGGRWQFTANGRVFAYGDAAFMGDLSTVGVAPAQPIVGAVVLPDGSGYWLFGADGGVFAFGSAQFFGSVPGALSAIGRSAQDLAGPIVAMALIDDGLGYYLFGADGGVFAFGSAPFRGSLPSIGDSRREGASAIVGAIGWRNGAGYVLVSAGGETARFGGGPDYGDLAGTRLSEPIVAVASSVDDRSMVMVDGSGRVFPFGGSFLCDLLPDGSCGTSASPGNWTSIEIAGVRVSNDRLSLELVPTLLQRSSCTELRGFASLEGATLTLDLQKRPRGLVCTPGRPIAPDSNTTTVQLDEPLPENATVVFEPTARGVAYDGEASESDLIRRIRGTYEIRTTANQVEEFLRDPEFVENWSAYLPYVPRDHVARRLMFTSTIVDTYNPVLREALRSLGLAHLFVSARQSEPFLTIRMAAPSDPDLDVAAAIAEAWSGETVCLRYLYGECTLTISTAALRKTEVEVFSDVDARSTSCGVLRELDHVGWRTHWASTVDSLSWTLGIMSVRLDGVIFDGVDAGPVLAAGADAADALVVAPLWEGEPPWATSSPIVRAWDLATAYSIENCSRTAPAL